MDIGLGPTGFTVLSATDYHRYSFVQIFVCLLIPFAMFLAGFLILFDSRPTLKHYFVLL